MDCKSCNWLWTKLICCGWRKQDNTIEEVATEVEVIGDSASVKTSFDEIALNGPTEACHSALAVVSVSCPAISGNTAPSRFPKDDHRGSKHQSNKCKPHPELPIPHQRLSSESTIKPPSRAPQTLTTKSPPPTLNSQAGDGNHGTPLQNQGDVQQEVEPSLVPESSNELTVKDEDEGENHLNAGESVPAPQKDAKPSEGPNGAEDLTRFTSPANLPKKRNNATIIVYHVTVADKNNDFFPVGFKSDENDVEMVDLTNQSEDVEMADLTTGRIGGACGAHMEGAARPQGTQNVEVVATIEHGIPGTSVALKSGDYSSSINVVASMRYVQRSSPGGRVRSSSETSLCPSRGKESDTNGSKEAIVVIGDPGCKRTILWNEAVKVIYFDGSSKLRKSASSGEGQQDLVAWEIVPLKDAPRGSRSKWAKAVKSGFIRSDLCSLRSNGRRSYQSSCDLRRDGSDEDDGDESFSSFTSSSSTSSSGER